MNMYWLVRSTVLELHVDLEDVEDQQETYQS